MFVIHVGLFLNEIIQFYLETYVSLSPSLSLKKLNCIHVAYFNHAENLLKYLYKLLKRIYINKVTLNRLTDCINWSKFLLVV